MSNDCLLITRYSSAINFCAVKLPPGWSLTTIESNPSTPLPDLGAAVEGALARPLSSLRLIDLASPSKRVCIVFTDATRACPDHILVPAILRELNRAGVPDDRITLLCAPGLHRPSTHEEKIAKLGRAVVERYRVIDHDPSASVTPHPPAGAVGAGGVAEVQRSPGIRC